MIARRSRSSGRLVGPHCLVMLLPAVLGGLSGPWVAGLVLDHRPSLFESLAAGAVVCLVLVAMLIAYAGWAESRPRPPDDERFR